MIVRSGKELVSRYFGLRPVVAVYKGLHLVWEAARACFSKGWNNHKGWHNDEGWNND